MKYASFLLSMVPVLFLVGVGCHTKQPVAQNAPAQPAALATVSAAHPRIRVESIPNPQLTATSREGDKPGAVYSRNIIAVYIDTNGVGTSNYTWEAAANKR